MTDPNGQFVYTPQEGKNGYLRNAYRMHSTISSPSGRSVLLQRLVVKMRNWCGQSQKQSMSFERASSKKSNGL